MKTNYFRAILVLAFLCVVTVASAKCSRCHGTGRVKTFAGVTSYTTSNRRKQCPICKQMVLESEVHYDTCPQCNGVDSGGGSSTSSKNSDIQDVSADLMAWLEPAEALAVEELMHTLFLGKMEAQYCSKCDGSGKCAACGGIMNVDIDATYADICRICGGSGLCITCRGDGILSQGYVDWSEEERNQIVANINTYFDLARERKEKETGTTAASPNQIDGTSLSAASGDEQEDGEQMNADRESSKNPLSNEWLIGGVVLLVLGAFFLGRRK